MTEFDGSRYEHRSIRGTESTNRPISLTPYVKQQANKLVEAFKDPGGKLFYQNVARKYSEHEIDQAMTAALKYGRNPGAYFNKLISARPDSHE